MRKTRLFIGHTAEVVNPNFNNSGGGVTGWSVPAGNTFETDPNSMNRILVPYPDNAAGDYAVTQDIGVDAPGSINIEIGFWLTTGSNTGNIRVQIGNAWVDINWQTPYSTQNVTDENYSTPNVYKASFLVSQPDPIFGYKLVIRGGGDAVPGVAPVHRGIRYVYILPYTTFYSEVDLYDELDIPVTYNVADVRDISKKDSNFSLTVSLPNTNKNAQLFDCIHEITNFGSSFEMLKQYPAIVEVDNNRTFEGYLRLTKVVINDDKEISYECNLYSNFIEFVKRLGTTTLRGNEDSFDDLSFSEYATTLTQQDWEDRTDMFLWDTSTTPWTPIGDKPYGKDFYFTFIDKFPFGGRHSVTSSVSGIGDVSMVPVFFDETTPFLFYKEIWDKVFEWAGFSYVSDFIEDNNNTTPFRFDHLVYPAVNFQLTPLNEMYSIVQQTTTQAVIANSVFSYPFTIHNNVFYPIDGATGYVQTYGNPFNYLSLIESPTGQASFNPLWKYTVSNNGLYSVNLNIPFDVWLQLTDLQGNNVGDSAQVDFDTDATYQFHLYLVINRGGQETILLRYDCNTANYEAQYQFVGGVLRLKDDQFTGGINISAQAGDELYIVFDYEFQSGGKQSGSYKTVASWSQGGTTYHRSFYPYLQFLKSDMGSNQIEVRLISDFVPGAYFDPTIILNPKRKKVDFINDIIKKFNLYVEDVTNKKDANGVYYRDYTTPNVRRGEPILRVEPRPLYYDNQYVVKNWTDRVDVSSIEFQRIDDYIYKWLDFNDKDDKTYHVTDYNNYEYTEGEYGEEKITSQMNTSADEKTEIKTSLGQTMCGLVGTSDVNIYQNQYLQAPYIFTLDDNGNTKKDKEYEDRMLFLYSLYWHDFEDIFLQSGLQGWRLYTRNLTDPDNFHPANGVLNVFSYNLLDTFNAPFGTDTADLNFGWANWYYQNLNGTWATGNTCYNIFYKGMVDEYNDPNARMMTCKMYLTPADIRDIRLSDVIIVNEVAYHINKISQWKNGEEPVKVELIKIVNSGSMWKPKPKGPSVRPNNHPNMEIITPVKLRDDLNSVEKVVKENSEAIASDKTAIDAILKTIANLDARLKKLEGKTVYDGFKYNGLSEDEKKKVYEEHLKRIGCDKFPRGYVPPETPKTPAVTVTTPGQLYRQEQARFNSRNNPINLNLV